MWCRVVCVVTYIFGAVCWFAIAAAVIDGTELVLRGMVLMSFRPCYVRLFTNCSVDLVAGSCRHAWSLALPAAAAAAAVQSPALARPPWVQVCVCDVSVCVHTIPALLRLCLLSLLLPIACIASTTCRFAHNPSTPAISAPFVLTQTKVHFPECTRGTT